MARSLKIGSTYTATVSAEVTADVDVVVAGGGTAGVVAALAAARTGATILLVERANRLGGMITAGNAGLTKYTLHDKRPEAYRKLIANLADDPASVQVAGGIPMEITKRLIAMGAALGTSGQAGTYVFTSPEEFKVLLLDMMQDAGVRLLLHSLIVDVVKDGPAVRGIVVENKAGRQVLLAKMVVDATGDGDVAAQAGAPFIVGVGPDDPCAKRMGMAPGTMGHMGVMFRVGNVNLSMLFEHLKTHPKQFSMQSCALMALDEAYEAHLKGEMMTINVKCPTHSCQIYNTPIPGVVTLCCPCYEGSGLDVEDLTLGEIALVKEVFRRVTEMKTSMPGFENAFLLDMPEIGVRETRHIQGEYVLNIEDVLSQRDFPDTIGRGGHPIDVGPVPKELKDRPMTSWSFNMPYRALVAKGVDNILLAGRCISATHEAFGCTRPTVQCMITGQAAGTAAAMCVAQNRKPRDLDPKELRKRLVADGVVL
jgi:ribulose 1,5-bisphosphate synthetase/thiazole synthase